MPRHRSPRGRALLLLVTLSITSACGGEVVRYHDARVAPDGVTILAGDEPIGSGTGEVAAALPVEIPGTDTDTTATPAQPTAGTDGALPAATAGTAPSVTSVSGPAARKARQAASGSPAPATGPAGGPAGTPEPGDSGGGASARPATGGAAAGDGRGVGPAPGGPSPVPGGGSTVGLTKDTITIGVFYPKTGAYAGIARNAQAVSQAAFDEAGPINGRHVVLKYYDDGTANASTIQTEEKRAKDEVFALTSFVGETNVVLAPLVDRHKVPTVVGNIDRKVALPLTYVFPVYAYWAHQATILPSFIKNVLGGGSKKIGIVYEGTSTAIDAKEAFKDKAKGQSLNVVFEQPIAQNQSTCANEVSNLQAHGVELVFMLNGPLGGICMLRDAKALAYKPTWTGVGVSWGFNVVAQASGGAADGLRVLRSTPTLESPEGQHFTQVMRKYAPNSGADGDDIVLVAYALLRSFIEALRRAGPDLTRESFVQTWETKMNGYDSGYLPPPTFGPGNRSGPLVVGVAACCTNSRWTTPQPGWRATF